jgi:hypothetical protein
VLLRIDQCCAGVDVDVAWGSQNGARRPTVGSGREVNPRKRLNWWEEPLTVPGNGEWARFLYGAGLRCMSHPGPCLLVHLWRREPRVQATAEVS